MRTVGRFATVDEFGDLIVKREGGAEVRLHDVAEVRLGHFEIRGRSFSGGEPSLSLAVQREVGSNVIAIKEAMLPVVDALRREIIEPAGMTIRLVNDDVRYVRRRCETCGRISPSARRWRRR